MDMTLSPERTTISRRRPEWSRWSGPIFVVLLIAGEAMSVPASLDPDGSSLQEYADYYAKDHPTVQMGVYLAVLSSAVFVWFLARIRTRVDSMRSRTATGAAMLAGMVYILATLIAISLSSATALAAEINDGFQVDANLAVAADAMAFGMGNAAHLAAGVLGWAIALAGHQAGVLARWMVISGYVLAAVQPIAWIVAGLPTLLFFVWLIAVSMRSRRAAAP